MGVTGETLYVELVRGLRTGVESWCAYGCVAGGGIEAMLLAGM